MSTTRYTFAKPNRAGMYWWLESPTHDPQIIRVFRDNQGYWSYQYDELHLRPPTDWENDERDIGSNFIENVRGAFCGPIEPPKRPARTDWPET